MNDRTCEKGKEEEDEKDRQRGMKRERDREREKERKRKRVRKRNIYHRMKREKVKYGVNSIFHFFTSKGAGTMYLPFSILNCSLILPVNFKNCTYGRS